MCECVAQAACFSDRFDSDGPVQYTHAMEVKISPTPEQEAFIREAVAGGRFQTAKEAAREALAQWAARERSRSELLTELESAEASLARGEGRQLTAQSIPQFIDEIKRRGRSRLSPAP